MRYYEGNQPCAGCGRTGAERARLSKDSLCPECRQLLNRAKIAELEPREYTRVFVTWYSFYYSPLNGLVNEFLKKLSLPEASVMNGGIMRMGDMNAVTASDKYYIPTFVAKALDDLIKGLQEEGRKLKQQEAVAREAAEVETAKCKQQYFEEGVRYGRQLLSQLNRGEITLADFEAIPKKYSK